MLTEPENHERRPGAGAALSVVAGDNLTVPDFLDGMTCLCGHPRAGLLFDAGQRRRCEQCASPAELKLVTELDGHAQGIGLPRRPSYYAEWGHVYEWPTGPNVHVDARSRLVAWAEHHDLRRSSRQGHHCLSWLLTGRCNPDGCAAMGGRVVPFLAPQFSVGGWDWFDHVTSWTRADGSPAALVAQPYHVTPACLELLATINTHPQLNVELASTGSWYGLGTWSVSIWRAER